MKKKLIDINVTIPKLNNYFIQIQPLNLFEVFDQIIDKLQCYIKICFEQISKGHNE